MVKGGRGWKIKILNNVGGEEYQVAGNFIPPWLKEMEQKASNYELSNQSLLETVDQLSRQNEGLAGSASNNRAVAAKHEEDNASYITEIKQLRYSVDHVHCRPLKLL